MIHYLKYTNDRHKNVDATYALSFIWHMGYHTTVHWGLVQYKDATYPYRESHCGDEKVLWLSYLHNGISYTGKMTSLYWIKALDILWYHFSKGLWKDTLNLAYGKGKGCLLRAHSPEHVLVFFLVYSIKYHGIFDCDISRTYIVRGGVIMIPNCNVLLIIMFPWRSKSSKVSQLIRHFMVNTKQSLIGILF